VPSAWLLADQPSEPLSSLHVLQGRTRSGVPAAAAAPAARPSDRVVSIVARLGLGVVPEPEPVPDDLDDLRLPHDLLRSRSQAGWLAVHI
jgi:hypothetical protein